MATKNDAGKASEIMSIILTSDDPRSKAWVEWAICQIHDNQTADEQAANVTSQSNGIGFTGYDAEFGSNLALWVKKGTKNYNKRFGQCFSPKQEAAARKLLAKYHRQINMAYELYCAESTEELAKAILATRVGGKPKPPFSKHISWVR